MEAKKSIVKVHGGAGHGVLVAGNKILTTCHCVDWDGRGQAAQGEVFLEDCSTLDGKPFSARVEAVEPFADIALLGPPEAEQSREHFDAYMQAVGATPSIGLSEDPVQFNRSIEVLIHNLDGGWVKGEANALFDDRFAGIEAEHKIESGASGGPIVTLDGRLVCVVSVFSEQAPFTGHCPMTLLTLPVWAVNELK